jgi:hypothetical protein
MKQGSERLRSHYLFPNNNPDISPSKKVGDLGVSDMTEHSNMRTTIDALIAATNAFDIETALDLFASDAIIDDVSVGDSFIGGVRDYLERFFVGYHTATRLLSVDISSKTQARVRVDFTGDFGHEIGLLEISANAGALIVRVDADLE